MEQVLKTLDSAIAFLRERGDLPMAVGLLFIGASLVEHGGEIAGRGYLPNTGFADLCPRLCGINAAENFTNCGVYIIAVTTAYIVVRTTAASIVQLFRGFRNFRVRNENSSR